MDATTAMYAKAITAGILFGAWQLVLPRTGLSGNAASLMLVALATVVILPFVIKGGGFTQLETAKWVPVVVMATLFAGGILFLNSGITQAAQVDLNKIVIVILVMMIAQILTPVIWQGWVDGGFSTARVVGILMAIGSAILLTR